MLNNMSDTFTICKNPTPNWVSYKNGNYFVRINLVDGTKEKFTMDDEFIPQYPESMDVKITNQCDMGCPMCHEASTVDGKHGKILGLPFWDTLLPYTEIAIGGGNALSHPDLIPFLQMLKDKKMIPNITVNQIHFMKNIDLLRNLVNEKLIYGVGISLVNATDEFINAVSAFDNAVIHVINGIVTSEQIKALSGHNLKMLILGFKDFRRGVDYHASHSDSVKRNQNWVSDNLSQILSGFKVVSFDNLALRQINVKSMMSDAEWERFFMGDDGIDGNFNSASMYIDLVNAQYGANSCSVERYPLLNNILDMFQNIQRRFG